MAFNYSVYIDALFLEISARYMHFFERRHDFVNIFNFEERIFQQDRELLDLLVEPVTENWVVLVWGGDFRDQILLKILFNVFDIVDEYVT